MRMKLFRSVIIPLLRAFEFYFPVVLFVMLCEVVLILLNFECIDGSESMNVTEQFSAVGMEKWLLILDVRKLNPKV